MKTALVDAASSDQDCLTKIRELALYQADLGIVLCSDKHVVFANDWFYQTSGLSADMVLNHPLSEIFPEPLPKRLLNAVDSAIQQGRSSVLSHKLNRSPFPLFKGGVERESGERIHQMVYVKCLTLDDTHFSLIEIFDVSQASAREKHLQALAKAAKESASALRDEQEKTQAILDSALDCIISLDESGNLTSANRYTCALFGLSFENLIGRNAKALFKLQGDHFLAGEHPIPLEQWATVGNTVELSAIHANGTLTPIELSLNNCALDPCMQYVGIIRDISAKKKAEENLYYLSRFDALTGLANRTLFTERLVDSIQRAKRSGHKFAVLCIDVDRFKAINETLGYDTGDEVLCVLAKRMENLLRETDTISRIGSDEFMIITEGLHRDFDVKLIIEKLFKSLRVPIAMHGQELHTSVSIGISFYPDNGTDEQTLYRNADIAMHNAKQDGRNGYKFFSQKMNSRVGAWIKTVSDLHRAIDEAQFEMHFQPQIDARTEELVGVEGLIRWNHPEEGRVSPEIFIPVAEDTGLIWPIGKIVIEQCCEAARLLASHVKTPVRVAINISPKQFQKTKLHTLLINECRKHDITPSQIELEITEGLLMESTNDSEAIMKELVQEGFTFSIDDFGTGYSSLAYLRRFPITTLKVDRSFVMDLPNDADASALSRAIINLAHSLRLEVVAEGVETADQLEFLKTEGCEFIQGYYYSKPLPLSELIPWIDEYSQNK